MKKHNVFHLISHFDLGGAENVALNIARSRNPQIRYHMVEVVRGQSAYSDQFIKEMQAAGIIVHRSPVRQNKAAIILFPFWFFRIFQQWHPDVIHTHTEIPDLSIYLFFRMFGRMTRHVRLIRTIHNTQLWNQWKGIGLRVEAFFRERARVVAISPSTQQSYRKAYSLQCPIIYNGVPLPQHIMKFEGLANGKINVVFAGRMEYQKGIPVLANVVKQLNADSRFFFHLIGEGSLKEKLLRELDGCTNYRHYATIYRLADYLGSFDYLFMPSEFEGLALMPLEAGMARTPSIINTCMGLEETLPPDWPLKAHQNNVADYLRIFQSLPHIDYAELQEKAFAYVSDQFGIRKMQQQYENLYLG